VVKLQDLIIFQTANISQTFIYFSGTTIDLISNNPSDPATLALFSGFYRNSLAVYPGHGRHGTANRVGRVAFQQGVYMATGYSDILDSITARYFYAHPNLKWITTSVANVKNVAGRIGVNTFSTGTDNHIPTRHNLTKYQQIGGLWVKANGYIDFQAFYYDENTVKWTQGVIDVLACQ
jgi:hypothetical protein